MHSISRRAAACAAALCAAWLAGCGQQEGATRAKGGLGSTSSAAVATACSGLQTCTSTDAHAAHQAAGLDCVSCHPCGGKFGFRDGFQFPGGTTIQPTDSFTPGSPPSCTVACHAPHGSPSAPVAWDAPAPLACVACHDALTLTRRFPDHPPVSAASTRADCEACHLTGSHTSGAVQLRGHAEAWADPADAGFHAFAADRGIAACQTCHRPDLSGGRTGVACASCHRDGGTAGGFSSCTTCHGGRDGATGAPPAALWGFAGEPARGGGAADPVRVGAHTAHVVAGAYGAALGCETCHLLPGSVITSGHLDTAAAGDAPRAEVTFGGLAVNGGPAPAWDRGAATCSSVYCHGATLSGGTLTEPTWTGGAGQVFCGSCHGVPPPAPHVAVDTRNGPGVCTACHGHTVDGTGRIIPAAEGGTHLNGLVEASGHGAGWMERADPGFHAFAANRGIANCTACHGADLGGGALGSACADCHRPGGPGNDFASCTACHGGALDATGAPPGAIWGYAGDPLRGGGAADPVRVGAHRRHLAPAWSSALDCAACHVKPAGVLSPGHVDDPTPVASVTFAGLAAQVPPGAPPSWDRAAAACASTYCHGNYAGAYAYEVWDWGTEEYVPKTFSYVGGRRTPGWLDGAMTCTSCHGNPPSGGSWHSGRHGQLASQRQCQTCHPDATSTAGVGLAITNPALHVNGRVEVTPQWASRCFYCH